ncbi:MAG TPA: bifunctional DNA-formamidopyrimidine glycosylase/DNA-(apurinic or apyrimidinic site) lyase [Vicinamibacteria bacterium]|nr:bifunctional DNA-formamidopyrimidine glycosylase/DNA-(apurinic or apyrimidinic site) lyase [Vicinamibacteria bacterium]
MPELPEVEVTRRQLRRLLVGRRIAAVVTTRPSYFFLTSPAVLRRRLRGRRFVRLDRVGKYMLAGLDSGERLLLHLGMTGEILREGAIAADRHVHLRFAFEDGRPGVVFRDERKFGKVQLLAAGETSPRVGKLGPDALGATAAHLFAASRGRRVPVKTLLLDQAVLAGVGNIYADEALFLAAVRPTRRAGRVTRAECEAIATAVRRVLRRAIATGGSSIDDYLKPDGSEGAYQEERHVYGRRGESCPRCRTAIRRVAIGQRSSHYCPSCQR